MKKLIFAVILLWGCFLLANDTEAVTEDDGEFVYTPDDIYNEFKSEFTNEYGIDIFIEAERIGEFMADYFSDHHKAIVACLESVVKHPNKALAKKQCVRDPKNPNYPKAIIVLAEMDDMATKLYLSYLERYMLKVYKIESKGK